MSVFGLVNYNEEQYLSANNSVVTKEKCIYYNRTTGRIITPAYEGIPENLLLNFLGWIMLVTLFACLRKRAWNYGRLALVQKNEERWTQLFYGTLDDVVGATEVNSVTSLDSTVHIDRGFCSWIIAIFKIKDENILAKSGYDAVQYLSFQRHIIVLVAIICVISLSVVLPINFQGYLQAEERSFGHTTVSNLEPGSNWLWVHVTLSLLYLPLGIYIMRRFSVNLKVEDRDTVSRTLMISDIPRRSCDADDLHRHFREAYPEFEVQGIQLAYNITKVSRLDKARETAYQARIYCDNYLKDTGIRLQMRPYLCGNICSCCDMYGCPTVDAIDYYTDEESRLQAQVDLERTTALKRPLGIVFVTLVSIAAAKKIYSDHQRRYACLNNLPESSVSRRLKHHRWKVQFAPSPRDICWENLSVSRKNFQIKAWLLNGFLSVVFFFLTTPPIIVSVMDTLVFNQVEKMGPVVSEFLPTLLLWTVAALLPVIVSHSDEWLNHWTRSQRNHSIMRKTFIFLLFMVLILPALGLTSAQAFVLFALDSHNETYRWECLFMPDKGAFFVNYVITSAFIGTSLELIRFPELFVYTLRLCLARSKAESVSLRNTIMWEFPFGLQYAWMLLIFAMTTVFSLSCPLITPFGLLYMCLKHCVDRYNLYFAYGPSKISTRIHATAIKYVVLSIVLLQFSFMLLSVMRQGFNTISIYALTGFVVTIIIFILHSNLRFCSGLSPIYHQAKPAPSASPSLSSPRHGSAARHQFVPDVLLRGTTGAGDSSAPRQPDLVTVYSPGESCSTSQRNYGTDQHRAADPDSDSNSRYQNYDTNSTQA
ncbi:calcium permeable stress-gated cation channel 1-like isoform X1 [Macrosteles quadrilineatus]|uniref:calcium permeable stress-gated cation channel 1-like isoform X1 n=1 Tax=Macrosteles quadrilineatus TaxID=74068 RepID=UPI0023E093E6|nr:calcium permeable stress-gated cation channel 1-like isoform X1 [Macrosteles quadrilineatus]XP_054283649.1 calcium permeable stress-gated cation channel 1-like isoform X1 [Macrosteles quadrilineatus]